MGSDILPYGPEISFATFDLASELLRDLLHI
jgi:hypothetical protein